MNLRRAARIKVWNKNQCTNLVKKKQHSCSFAVLLHAAPTMHRGNPALLCCACEREAGGGLVCASGGSDFMRARQTLDSNAFSSLLCSPEFFTDARGIQLALKWR